MQRPDAQTSRVTRFLLILQRRRGKSTSSCACTHTGHLRARAFLTHCEIHRGAAVSSFLLLLFFLFFTREQNVALHVQPLILVQLVGTIRGTASSRVGVLVERMPGNCSRWSSFSLTVDVVCFCVGIVLCRGISWTSCYLNRILLRICVEKRECYCHVSYQVRGTTYDTCSRVCYVSI